MGLPSTHLDPQLSPPAAKANDEVQMSSLVLSRDSDDSERSQVCGTGNGESPRQGPSASASASANEVCSQPESAYLPEGRNKAMGKLGICIEIPPMPSSLSSATVSKYGSASSSPSPLSTDPVFQGPKTVMVLQEAVLVTAQMPPPNPSALQITTLEPIGSSDQGIAHDPLTLPPSLLAQDPSRLGHASSPHIDIGLLQALDQIPSVVPVRRAAITTEGPAARPSATTGNSFIQVRTPAGG